MHASRVVASHRANENAKLSHQQQQRIVAQTLMANQTAEGSSGPADAESLIEWAFPPSQVSREAER